MAHAHAAGSPSESRLALSATLHCLTGCSIGEITGMVAGNLLDWPALVTLVVSVLLAFAFGYALTLRPLLGAGLPWRTAWPLAAASDTLSITVMEIVDNAIMIAIPGAMDAPAHSPRFWGSLGLALAVAGLAAYPVNRWLIRRGRGHALVHDAHARHTPHH